MPRALASFGLCTVTGLPSKRYSPESNSWLPAIPLIRVDLPAPLSPTSAVTWPRYASKSTSCRTCTAPKLLFTARSDRIGSSSPTGGAVAVALGIVMLTSSPEAEFRWWLGTGCRTRGGDPDRTGPGPHPPGQAIPAVLQAEANAVVQTSEAFWKPSSMTSFTLALKIETGVWSADGTSLLRTVSLTVPLTMLFVSWFLIRAIARSEAALASF